MTDFVLIMKTVVSMFLKKTRLDAFNDKNMCFLKTGWDKIQIFKIFIKEVQEKKKKFRKKW